MEELPLQLPGRAPERVGHSQALVAGKYRNALLFHDACSKLNRRLVPGVYVDRPRLVAKVPYLYVRVCSSYLFSKQVTVSLTASAKLTSICWWITCVV